MIPMTIAPNAKSSSFNIGKTDENSVPALFADEIRLLTATLKMSTLGGLSVAECESRDLQNILFSYFKERLESEKIYLFPFEINPNELNLVKTLMDLSDQARFKNIELTGKYKNIVIFVHGIDALNDEARHRFFQLLNFFRDRFTSIEHPIVIWSKQKHVKEMAQSAPDFWSWKSDLFYFPADSVALANNSPFINGKHPVEQYLSALLNDSEYTIWSDLYLPLQAVRTADTTRHSTTREHFTAEELAQLSQIFPDTQVFTAGKTIIKQGDIGKKCYIILWGKVDIRITDAVGNQTSVAQLKQGDFFGEIALIKNIRRTATVKALAECRIIALDKAQLRTAAPKIAKHLALMGNVAEHRTEALSRNIVPDDASPLRRFANQQISSHANPVNVSELIQDDRRVTILGDAGMGKTTTLRYFMLQLARKAKENFATEKDFAIPIFIKLNALSPTQSIENLILETMQGYGLIQFENEDDIRALLKRQDSTFAPHEFVFIMDGLNEIQGDLTTRKMLGHFIQTFADDRFIITCRERDYLPIADFRSVLLRPLKRKNIQGFLSNYLGQERGLRVSREILADPQLVELAHSPLALYMFTQLAKKTETLPKNRGVLFEHFTNNLLERIDSEWWKIFGRSGVKTPLFLRKNILAKLGLYMQENQQLTITKREWFIIIGEAYTEHHQSTPKYSDLSDIHEEIKFSGLIRYSHNLDKGRIEFAHHTYQEFFAASALMLANSPIAEYLKSPETLGRWYGTIVLLYGISTDRTPLFSQILGDAANYARIWLAAQCLANSGAEIARITDELVSALPDTQKFPLLFALGLASYQMGHYPEALTYLLRAADINPDNAEIQYELGTLYRQLKQYDRAIQHLENAIRQRADFVDAYNQLGINYCDQGKYEEALTIFNVATQLEPTNAYHYFNLGSVQKIIKDYKTARDTVGIALQLKPDYEAAQTQFDLLDKAISSGVVQVLEKIPMLSKLTLEQSVFLVQRMSVSKHEANDIIFNIGDMGDTFYIIESGRVRVLDSRRNVINQLTAGSAFGEIALLRNVPRTATIQCAGKVQLLSLKRNDFNTVMLQYPSAIHTLAETSGSHLRMSHGNDPFVVADDYYNPNYLQKIIDRQDEVTVIMGDIHGSTFLTNAIEPALMVDFLDDYLLRMSKIVVSAGGAMDKSLGDSVMGVFGKYAERPGESLATPALRALLAAEQMRQEYALMREEWKAKDERFAQTGMGVGIATGKVKVGTVGSDRAMVGPPVNQSNKLSGLSVGGRIENEIYIEERTCEILGDTIQCEPVDADYVATKSSGTKLTAYHVIGSENILRQKK